MNQWSELGTTGRNRYKVSETVVDMCRPQANCRSIALSALPQNLIIDLSRSALMIIDMQNDFCGQGGWISSMGVDFAAARELVAPINAVADALRAQNVPVLWVNWGVRADRANLSPSTQHPFNPNGSGPGLAGSRTDKGRSYKVLQKGEWGAELIEGLTPRPEDIQIDKHRISGFWDTPLDSVLRNLNISTLLFAGINADHCVYATLMDANFHGYDTVMLEDCVATTSPDFCMAATLHNVRFCFGFTTTSAQLLEALAEVAELESA
ncbi:MAG TPA: isochorismatase family cysteine hydrolase [Sphingomicrobium sp.]|nr:isochorismatase family cysteine hydrolase [Sphingomicrobium sp.]